jgi:phospholipid/cholesterol/gamma-HCH transport system permease protein
MGDLAVLLGAALAAPFRPAHGQPHLTRVVARQFEGLLIGGVPLIALIHVGFGSFLAMQAFFRATIADANGAVVGLGLMRSVAPMLTGMCLAWLLAVRYHAELGGGLRRGLDDDPSDVPDRDIGLGRRPDTRAVPDVGRVVLGRLIAAVLAGPVLTAWGAMVGFVVGAVVSRSMLGLAPGTYFGFFFEMLQVPDVLSVLVTGSGYAAASALFSCREALGSAPAVPIDGPLPLATFCPESMVRAVLYSSLAMLLINATWFTLAYNAGAPFGPRLALTGGG